MPGPGSGHAETARDSDSRGPCRRCGQDVTTAHTRGRHEDGSYYHVECPAPAAAPTPSPAPGAPAPDAPAPGGESPRTRGGLLASVSSSFRSFRARSPTRSPGRSASPVRSPVRKSLDRAAAAVRSALGKHATDHSPPPPVQSPAAAGSRDEGAAGGDSRGPCRRCGQDVTTAHTRGRHEDGSYYHVECPALDGHSTSQSPASSSRTAAQGDGAGGNLSARGSAQRRGTATDAKQVGDSERSDAGGRQGASGANGSPAPPAPPPRTSKDATQVDGEIAQLRRLKDSVREAGEPAGVHARPAGNESQDGVELRVSSAPAQRVESEGQTGAPGGLREAVIANGMVSQEMTFTMAQVKHLNVCR